MSLPLPHTDTLPSSKYSPGTTHTIPARSGVAVPLPKSHIITVINTYGTQVIDFWFLAPASTPPSHLSMCHTRASTLRLSPLVGDTLVSTHRQPLLEFVEDSTPAGIHDTLIAACDIHRYHQLGVPPDQYHDSCTDNFRRALAADVAIQVADDTVPPDPFNLFMNIPVVPNSGPCAADTTNEVKNVSVGAKIAFEAPVCRSGDFVRFRALVDGVVVMSACPQDILKINNKEPTSAEFRIDIE